MIFLYNVLVGNIVFFLMTIAIVLLPIAVTACASSMKSCLIQIGSEKNPNCCFTRGEYKKKRGGKWQRNEMCTFWRQHPRLPPLTPDPELIFWRDISKSLRILLLFMVLLFEPLLGDLVFIKCISATPNYISKFFEGIYSALKLLLACKANSAKLGTTLKGNTKDILLGVSKNHKHHGIEIDSGVSFDEGLTISGDSSEVTLIADLSSQCEGDDCKKIPKNMMAKNMTNSIHSEVVARTVVLLVTEDIGYDAVMQIITLYLTEPESLDEITFLAGDISSACSENNLSDCFTAVENVTPLVTSPSLEANKLESELGCYSERSTLAEALVEMETCERPMEEMSEMISSLCEKDYMSYEEALKESMLDELYGHDYVYNEPCEAAPPTTPSSITSGEDSLEPTMGYNALSTDELIQYESDLAGNCCNRFSKLAHKKIESSKNKWNFTRDWWHGWFTERRNNFYNSFCTKSIEPKLLTFEWEPEILTTFKKKDPPVSNLANSRLSYSLTPAKKVLKAPPRNKARDTIKRKLKDYYQIPYDKPLVPLVPEDDLMIMLWDYVRETYGLPLEHFLEISSLHREFNMGEFVKHCRREGFPVEKWPTIEELIASPTPPPEVQSRSLRRRDVLIHKVYLHHKRHSPDKVSKI